MLRFPLKEQIFINRQLKNVPSILGREKKKDFAEGETRLVRLTFFIFVISALENARNPRRACF